MVSTILSLCLCQMSSKPLQFRCYVTIIGYNLLLLKIIGAEHSSLCINYTAYIKLKDARNQAFIDFWKILR